MLTEGNLNFSCTGSDPVTVIFIGSLDDGVLRIQITHVPLILVQLYVSYF